MTRASIAFLALLLFGCSSNTTPTDRGLDDRAPTIDRRLVDLPPRDLPPPAAGAPAIFYTDLTSAPANAYVTLWGRGFGTTQGSSTVTHAGAAVAKIVSWSDRVIELRVSATPKPGDLVVTTTAGSSLPVPLGVHSGKIYFVATNGKDNWSGTLEAPSASGSDGPFRSLVHARALLKAGDVIYVRASSFLQVDNYSAILSLLNVPTGTASAPIAIVGYPGEVATLGDNKVLRSFSLYRGDNGPPLDYLTIAKLHLRPSCNAIAIGTGDYGRFVGNEISGATDACQSGVVTAAGGQGWKILGNYVHDNGNTKFEHGVYLGGYGAQKGFEIAYNRIEQQKGGRGIQLYGHKASDRIEQISIHDNEISETDRDGIVLGATDADVLYLSDIKIYNNIFHRAGRCVGSGVRVGNSTAVGIVVVHNTFVDNGRGDTSCHDSTGAIGAQIEIDDGAAVEIRNNILVAVGGSEKYLDMIKTPATFLGSNNLFSGGGTPPTWDPSPVSTDPQLADVATHDFHVPSTSPAVGKGAPGLVAVDHDGEPRPPAAPTIGAYEPSK
jgi:hypothetical protein